MNPAVPDLYIDLLKRTLTRFDLGDDVSTALGSAGTRAFVVVRHLQRALGRHQLELVRRTEFGLELRRVGRDRPAFAETMVGVVRLDNVEHCVRRVLADRIPGDLVEAGVWRGGTAIFVRGLLAALGDEDRAVWAADSFRGLPPPSGSYVQDAGDVHWTQEELAVSVDEVKANFAKYGLLDARVNFLEGWFSDTLPSSPIEKIAVLRIDGDMYESTWDVLTSLGARVSIGGYVIVDDYGALTSCKAAVDDYRREHAIDDPIQEIDWTGIYWRRTG